MEWLSYEKFIKVAGVLNLKEYKDLISIDYRNKLENSLESSGIEDDDILCFSADSHSLSILGEIIKENPELHIASGVWINDAGENYSASIIQNSVRFVDRSKYYLCKGLNIEVCCEERVYFDNEEDGSYYDEQEVFFINNQYYDKNGKVLDE